MENYNFCCISAIVKTVVPENKSKNEFIEEYKIPYFISDMGKDIRFHGLNQTSNYVEEVLFDENDGIIYKDEWEDIDVFKVLAWKLGGIKQKESSKDVFKYKKD